MKVQLENLFARIIFIPFSAPFAFHLFTQFGNSLNSIFYYYTEDYYPLYLRFDTRAAVILVTFVSWLAFYFILELISFFRQNFRFKKLLTNFRYAPIAVSFLSFFIITAFDLGMIEYSKWKIRDYVFSDSKTISEPDFRLHNNDRGWCGNGAAATENYLYFETASEGINDENPYVRSRSLLMSAEVRNWINGGDARFDKFLINACLDSNDVVHNVAEQYLADSNSNCRKLLSSK